ncbi:MAG: hypothetical protein WCT31_02690, partial [Candidatus Micrarchaeia archaeon]
EEITITIANPKFASSLVKIGPSGSTPIAMAPGDSTWVIVKVTNDGEVPIEVTGVTATPVSFTATAVPDSLLGGSTGNGFNKEINPGDSKNLVVSVKAPAAIPEGTELSLKFKIEATEKTCKPLQAGQTFEMRIDSSNYTIEPVPSLKRCEFVPKNANSSIGITTSFDLFCYNATNSLLNCQKEGVTVSISPLSVAVFPTTPQQLTSPLKMVVKAKAAGLGNAKIVATNNQPKADYLVTCEANLLVTTETQSCEFVPKSKFIPIGGSDSFDLFCYDKNHAKVKCEFSDVEVSSSAPHTVSVDDTTQQSDRTLVEVSALKKGGATITASSASNPNVICTATVTSDYPAPDSCVLSPSVSGPKEVGEINLFQMTCYNDSLQTQCPGQSSLTITINPAVALLKRYVVQSSGVSSIQADNTKDGTGVLKVAAKNGAFSCSATIIVFTPIIPNNGNCSIAPNPAIGNTTSPITFAVSCTEGGKSVACGNPAWKATGLHYSVSSSGSSAAFNFPDEGAGFVVANITAASGSPPTYSCEAAVTIEAPPVDDTEITNLCNVVPKSLVTEPGKNERLNLSCLEISESISLGTMVKTSIPCTDVRWPSTPEGMPTSLVTQASATGAILSVNDTGSGKITVIINAKTPSERYSCSMNISSSAPPEEYNETFYCNINPNPLNTIVNSRETVSLKCFDLLTSTLTGVSLPPKEIPCENVRWAALTGLPHSSVYKANSTGAILDIKDEGKGSIRTFINYNTPSERYSCALDIFSSKNNDSDDNDTNDTIVSDVDACNITVDDNAEIGSNFNADLICFNKTTGVTGGCTNITWSLQGGHGTISGDNYHAGCTLTEADWIIAKSKGVIPFDCKYNFGESKKHCSIIGGPDPWIISPPSIFASMIYGVKCGDTANTFCDNYTAVWSVLPPDSPIKLSSLGDGTQAATLFTIPKEDVEGTISVSVEDSDGQKYQCETHYNVGSLECLNFV